MGVRARIVLYSPDEAAAAAAARAAFDRIALLEDIMSDYRPTSELMRLCDRAGGPPVRVSPALMFVLVRSQELSRRSHGAFDVTVGPLAKLWRAARKSGKLPAQSDLRAAMKLVGWRKISLDTVARTVSLSTPGMRLDLGGIAKGYACDEALRTIRDCRIESALAEMGGDIALGDAPPGADGWKIEIPNNVDNKSRNAVLANCAVSSSGDTEQFVVIEGKRYSHVVDPGTGLGLTSRLAVTVVAKNAMTSDGLATALSVLGPQKGRALLKGFEGATASYRFPTR